MRIRLPKMLSLPGTVFAVLLVLGPEPHAAYAVPRTVVEMGDPDVGNKPQSGPGQAATSPAITSTNLAKPRTSLWMTYFRLLISTRMTLR
jgi:hypothetical protein